jgi:SSS family solute:Na+ symporter
MFGMSLLWLTFLNIFVGIFIAFVFLGGPTRRMGHRLDAHTFPELVARRYQSRFLQVFSGLIIFLFIPLYAAAVLIGACAFIAEQFTVSYDVALLVFSVLVAGYVVVGGLKGVMYTDALQGSIMFIGMIVLLVATYVIVGGVSEGHQQLTDLGNEPNLFGKIGFTGWTSMPEFGFGEGGHALWWIVVSTITLGVGIGVLAQPQLAVRFMTVRSKKELNRAVLVGGVFILIMTGVAFTVGSLSNVYFLEKEEVTGKVVRTVDQAKVIVKRQRNVNPKNPEHPDEIALPCSVMELDKDRDGMPETFLITRAPGKLQAILPKAEIAENGDGTVTVKPHATAYLRALNRVQGRDGVYQATTKDIIPTFIGSAMPKWFGMVFLLTLLAAAMSTLSSQFHALGTSIGRDVYEPISGSTGKSIGLTRIGIIIGIVIAVLISYYNEDQGYIIARATAIFFGLCASAFLPAFVGGLFFRRATRAGAIASMVVGFTVTAFWLVLVKEAEASAIGLVFHLTDGKPSILADYPSWPVVDPIVIALPLSILTFVVVSLISKSPPADHLQKCFKPKP